MKLAYAAAIVALALTACKDGTSPKGIDPSVLVVNLSPDLVRVIFASDQSGALLYDTVDVAAGTTVCSRWTQSFDSLYTKVVDTLPNSSGHWSSVTAPWVHFSQYADYFQIDTVLASGQSTTSAIAAQEC